MEDNFEKLNLLLEQEQCEFVDIPDGFTGQTESGELRLIYLMNDAVESFLVLKNARMTGNYVRDYEGEFEGSLERTDRDVCEAEYILVIHQGQNVFTVFFEDILLETYLYNYGELGHFWVEGYENLRVMEYQIAILRDKYEYLGEKYCTEQERKLAMLRDFPPLNYLFYPAVPEKYIVPADNPWEVTAEALAVMQELSEEAGDEKLGKMLWRYEKNPDISNARKIAGMLCRSSHLPVVTLLGEKIREAASVYPDRDFGKEKNQYLCKLLTEAERKRSELHQKNVQIIIYREEPFIYDCDSISFQVYLMIVRKGVWKQKIMIEKM
ncbi:MAG: DUF3878 family protein [Eubacteriales bacterium]|nr:DUF3878 family protein [Eubacteriales bacterium]